MRVYLYCDSIGSINGINRATVRTITSQCASYTVVRSWGSSSKIVIKVGVVTIIIVKVYCVYNSSRSSIKDTIYIVVQDQVYY